MIEVGCYLCGSRKAVTLFKQEFEDPYLTLVDPALNGVTRLWNSCASCGFIYRTPILTESEQDVLYANYGDDVFKQESPDVYFDRIAGYPPAESENHAKSVWLKSILAGKKITQAPVEVLDVGCGAGLLMHSLKGVWGAGFIPHGVELNPDYAALARRRLDADVRQVDYQPGLFGKKFTLILCTKVLEHVRDPRDFVAKLAADLQDGGALFLEVPDVMDLENLPADHDRFYIPHIYFFSPATLAEICARAGLGILASRSITTGKGRSYLQLVASRSVPSASANPPYDDAEVFLQKRRAKFTN